ncbi:hypothetical protein [Gramella sp. AN32]|uniref:Uncharacterized protein n=1 Tax=Christiangramia antarctica TaxID=2058158 RepID=A0ABW5X350_9FLAO|nr:hypothetical protein [Gramella sp. AN32]MCM4156282.1 hypothetical protein [Gramella sp. AN32]
MKIRKKILYLFLFYIAALSSQNPPENCACCGSDYQSFDFWIGDWEVYNTEGGKIGENLVEALEGHCIINENWTGSTGGSGKSYNYYDPTDETWNQLWISSTGKILKLKGKAEANKMVLKSQLTSGKKGNYFNQITWTKNSDGSVTQLWELLDTEGKLISETFEGIYKKKNAQ